MYNIYVLCAKKNDGDDEKCMRQKFNAYTNCPNQWVSLRRPPACTMQYYLS